MSKGERDRLSGWDPRTGVYRKGGMRPRSAPPPPQVSAEIPKPPVHSGRRVYDFGLDDGGWRRGCCLLRWVPATKEDANE